MREGGRKGGREGGREGDETNLDSMAFLSTCYLQLVVLDDNLVRSCLQ